MKVTLSLLCTLIFAGLLCQQLAAAPVNSQQSLIPDFQVNENAGGASQVSAAVAMTPSGYFIVAWQDYRNGDADIYARRYQADGAPIGDEFMVSDDPGIAFQSRPSISCDDAGNFVVVWSDERNEDVSDNDIYAQRFAADGAPLGSNFLVNDDGGQESQNRPVVAMSGNGNFVVAWEDRRNGQTDIYARRYSSEGSPVAESFRVNDNSEKASMGEPAIAADQDGDCLIVWHDVRTGNYKIYAQRISNNGALKGGNFQVSEETASGRQWFASVGMNAAGDAVVSWQDERQGTDIFAQRYDSTGAAVGINFKVNDDSDLTSNRAPDVAVGSSGDFYVCWYAVKEYVFNVYTRRFLHDGSADGNPVKLNDDNGDVPHYYAGVAMKGDVGAVFVWEDLRNFDGDIYAQRFDNTGARLGDNFRINSDSGGSNQTQPALAVDENGNFIIAWVDKRNGPEDIYARSFNAAGDPVGTDFNLNDELTGVKHWNVDIAANAAGNVVSVWIDTRNNGDADVYGQLLTTDGTFVGSNFKINDDTTTAYQSVPAVAIDDAGAFMVVWQDNRNGNDDIYAQHFTSDGGPDGVNMLLNDDDGSVRQSRPEITTDRAGHYIVVWQDSRNGHSEVYAQLLDIAGAKLGGNVNIAAAQEDEYQTQPAVAADEAGTFVCTWSLTTGDNTDINAILYTTDGSPIGDAFQVNEETDIAYCSNSVVSTDDEGNFVVTWEDRRNGNPDVMGQKFQSDATPVGDNFLVHEPNIKRQSEPAVILRNNKIYNCWEDTRAGGTGYDIWANVLAWQQSTKVTSPSDAPLLNKYQLKQNFPNPFNPVTTIAFSLAKAGHVTLVIYDIRGQELERLVDDHYPAGRYRQPFDASRLSSGIYFYKMALDGQFVQMRKMLLVK